MASNAFELDAGGVNALLPVTGSGVKGIPVLNARPALLVSEVFLHNSTNSPSHHFEFPEKPVLELWKFENASVIVFRGVCRYNCFPLVVISTCFICISQGPV